MGKKKFKSHYKKIYSVGTKVYLNQVQTKLLVSHQRWRKRKEVKQQLRPFWVLSPARQFEVWLHTLGSIHFCDPFSTHCHLPATHPSICLPTLTKPLQTNSVRVTSQWGFCNYVLNTKDCTGMPKNTQYTCSFVHTHRVFNFLGFRSFCHPCFATVEINSVTEKYFDSWEQLKFPENY